MIVQTKANTVRYGDDNYAVERVFGQVAASQTMAEIVPARAGYKIVVLKVRLICGLVPTDWYFGSRYSSQGQNQVSQVFSNGVNGGLAPAFDGLPEFETGGEEALVATTGAGSTTSYTVWYIYVPAALGEVVSKTLDDMTSSSGGSAPITGDSSTTQEGVDSKPTGTGSAT